MSGKSTTSKENMGWLDDIGLSGPMQTGMDHDEIPGFVNASVFGRFSLDDLDFGDDLTKGRIDFDDEYLLKSPSPGSIAVSEGSVAKVRSRESYPERDSSGGYYHPPHGSVKSVESRATSYSGEKSKEPRETIRRQMPAVGRAIQERVFEGLEEVAGELNMDSKLLDSAKSFMDKAPTKWKLFEEQRKSSAINRRQSVRNHQASLENQMAMESQAALPREAAPAVRPRPAGRAGRKAGIDKRTGTGRRVSPIAVILIMLLIVRLAAFLFQANTHHINITHTEPDPKPGGTFLIGGGNDNKDEQIPDEIADAWTDLYNEVEQWRTDNPYVSWMDLSSDETVSLMQEAGWENAEIVESEAGPVVEAGSEQEHSTAYVSIDSESLGLSFYWDTQDEQPEDEVEAAWENLLPENSYIYPGMQVAESGITEDMLQAIKDYGEKDNYGTIKESSISVNGLYISLFDDENYGWDLYISGDGGTISFHTDEEEKTIQSIFVTGEENTWFDENDI